MCGRRRFGGPCNGCSARAPRHRARPISPPSRLARSRRHYTQRQPQMGCEQRRVAGAPQANEARGLCCAAANACHPRRRCRWASPIRAGRCLASSALDHGCAWPPGAAERVSCWCKSRLRHPDDPPNGTRAADRSWDGDGSVVRSVRCGSERGERRAEARETRLWLCDLAPELISTTASPAAPLPMSIFKRDVGANEQPAVSFPFPLHVSTANRRDGVATTSPRRRLPSTPPLSFGGRCSGAVPELAHLISSQRVCSDCPADDFDFAQQAQSSAITRRTYLD